MIFAFFVLLPRQNHKFSKVNANLTKQFAVKIVSSALKNSQIIWVVFFVPELSYRERQKRDSDTLLKNYQMTT
jgi:hypothetical protein